MNRKNYVNWLIDAEKLGIGFEDADRLHTLARKTHRLAEVACNYGLTPRQEKNDAKIDAEIRSIGEKYGLSVYLQGDPRGWPIYISKEPINGSNYTNGRAVPPY